MARGNRSHRTGFPWGNSARSARWPEHRNPKIRNRMTLSCRLHCLSFRSLIPFRKTEPHQITGSLSPTTCPMFRLQELSEGTKSYV